MKITVLRRDREPLLAGQIPDERIVGPDQTKVLDVDRTRKEVKDARNNPVGKILVQ